jgi:Spy/CpxP family protein refolding chaperone
MSYIRNNKVLLLIIAVLILANMVLLYFHLWRGHGGAPRKSMKEMVMMKLEKEVGFNKQQLAAYDSLRTKHFDSMKPMFDSLQSAKENFFKLVYQSAINDSLINQMSARINEKQQAIDVKMLKYFRTLKEISTEEQKPQMDSFLHGITKRMAGGFRQGPGPGQNKK